MKLSEIGFFIDFEIKKQFKSRKTFTKNTGRPYVNFTNTISKICKEQQDTGTSNIISILNDLGYELTIKEKDPTKK